MKKTKIFLILAISAVLMSGCSIKDNTSEDKEKESAEVEDGYDERDIEFSKLVGEGFLKVNMDYYNYCKTEYEYSVEEGVGFGAKNGEGVDIGIARIKGKDKIFEMGLYSEYEDKDNMLVEINRILKMNNYERMTKEEFDSVVWSDREKARIKPMMEDKLLLVEIQEGSYIEKGDLILRFYDCKDGYMVGFKNKDSFWKIKELADEEFGNGEFGVEEVVE